MTNIRHLFQTKLQWRLTLYLTLLIVAAVTVTTLLILPGWRSEITDSVGAQEEQNIAVEAANLNAFLQGVQQDIVLLKDVNSVDRLALALISGDESEIQAARQTVEHDFSILSDSRRIYDQIRFIDLSGNEVVRVDFDGQSATVINQANLQNKVDRDYFKQTIALGPDQLYVSRLDLNREGTPPTIEGTITNASIVPVLRYGTPVYVSDASTGQSVLAGVVVINALANDLLSLLHPSADDAEVYLVDNEGYYLYNSKSSNRVFGFEDEIESIGGVAGASLNDDLTRDEVDYVLEREADEEVVTENGLLIHRLRIAPPGASYYWVLLTTRDEGVVYSRVDSVTVLVIGVIVALILVSITFIVFTIGRVTRPLAELSHTANTIAQGNLSLRAGEVAKRPDEIGVLGQAFNDMAQQLSQLVQGLEERVTNRTQDLVATVEVGRLATTYATSDDLLPRLVNNIRERFDLYYTQIYLLDEADRYAHLRAGTGDVGQRLLAQKHRLDMEATSIVARTVQTGQPVLVSNTEQSQIHLPNPLLPLTRSEVAIPLIVGGDILGVLDMQAVRPETFNEENLPVFEALASQIAGVLRSQQAFTEAQQALAQVDELNRRLTRDQWEGYLGRVGRGNKVGYQYDLEAPKPLDTSTPLTDIEGIHASRPITLGSLPIGNIIIREDVEREFAPEEMQLIDDVAARVAQALEQLRTFDETETRARELETVAQVTTRASSTLNMNELLDAVVNLTKEQFNLYHVHVYLLDERQTSLVLTAGSGEIGQRMVKGGHRIQVKNERSLVARASRTRQAVVVNNVTLEPDFLPNPMLPRTRSEMAVPMVIGDELIGILDVQGDTLNRFTEQDIKIKTILASQLAVAVANARQFEQVATLQTRVQSILDNASSSIISIDAHQRIVLFNRFAELVFGYTADEILGQPLTILMPERFGGGHEHYVQVFAAEDVLGRSMQERNLELTGRRKDGTEFPIEVSISKQTIAGEPVFTAILNDISQRREFERNLQKRAVELQTVAEVSAAATNILDQQELLQNVVDLTKARFDLYHAHIYLFDERAGALVLAAGAGDIGRRMAASGHRIPLSRTHSLVVQAARTLKGVIVNDVSGSPDFLPNPLLPETASEMAIPIQVASRLYGVLDVQSTQFDRFTEEDVRIKTTLADQIAIALQNATTFQEVQVAKQEIERVYATSIDMLGSANFDGYFTSLNPAWEATLGFTRDELMAKPFIDFVHPDDTESTQTAAAQIFAGASAVQFENRYQRADGTFRWISWNSVPDMEHQLIHFVARDVTQEKRAALERDTLLNDLQEASENLTINLKQLSALQDVGAYGEENLTIEAYLTRVSERLAVSMTYDQATAMVEYLGQDYGDTSTRQAPQQLSASIAYSGQIYGQIIVGYHNDRTFSPEEDHHIRAIANRVATYLQSQSLFSQITKRAVELELVAEVTTAASSILDPAQLLKAVSNLTRDRFGLYHAHVYLFDARGVNLVLAAGAGDTGDRMAQRGHSIPLLREHSLVARAARTRQGVVSNDVTLEPDFLPNPLLPFTRSEMALPIITSDEVIGVLDVQSNEPNHFTTEDVQILTTLAGQIAIAITNARLYQEQLLTAERLREVDKLKSEFLASMSHELRTPLNSIIGYAEVMLDGLDGPLNEEMTEDVEAIHGSGKLLLNLINDILDLAKIEAGQMELDYQEIVLAPFLRQVLDTSQILVKDKDVVLQLELNENLPEILDADPIRIQQIINNLISNAAKFTEHGSITLRAIADNGNLHISVIDTGTGIRADKLDVIFERFRQADQSSTRRAGGTGLGLDITRRLVHMHSGRIWVESEFGTGSVFSFEIPLHRTVPAMD
ncbi:MAG: GAF domain-containing protein [Anaerolineales bacterium]|nr:GAF domain-containing protein [Anaerolineales bacterium]